MPKLTMRDGHKVHVRIIGKGKPIMLIHGFGMRSTHWLPFALPLSLKYQVIMPDLRGFGKSHCTPFNSDCVISNFVDDIYDISENLNLEPFKLAGISMGAMTGLKFTHSYPEKVLHYMHIDQGPRCKNNRSWEWGLFGHENIERIERGRLLIESLEPYAQTQTPFDQIPHHIKQLLWDELGDFFSSALSTPKQKALAKQLTRFPALMTRILPTKNWPAYLHCMKSYLHKDYDFFKELTELDTPISLLVGMKSDMYPSKGQLKMADYAQNCRVLPFTRSGHAPLIDQPLKLLNELHNLASA